MDKGEEGKQVDTDLGTRLTPAQLKELQLIAAMIARGESPATVERGWKKFVKRSADELGLLETEETGIGISEIVQWVFREAYLEASEDLQFYADKVRFFNEQKKAVRDELAKAREMMDAYIDCLERRLSLVGDDDQLAYIDLQNSLQKQGQVLQMISNITKMLHDTAKAIIRNLR